MAQIGTQRLSGAVLTEGGDRLGKHRAPGKVRWSLSLRRRARRAVSH